MSSHTTVDLKPQRSILITDGKERSDFRINRLRNFEGNKKVSFFDFKGLMAPVFTNFKDDSTCSLDTDNIDRYAQWLKSERICGVLVNSITGEGPALGLNERKLNAEVWYEAAIKHELILMLQVGGAPLPDVIELAKHAEQLGVHAVLCLPELFYRPKNIDQLVGYCRIIAKHCPRRPFFYYHIPKFTQVNFDMVEFCNNAENSIPNFFGLQYSCSDLDMGASCLSDGRVILLGHDKLLAPGLLLGFEAILMSFLNVRPDLGWEIYNAMKNNDMKLAKEKQKQLNHLINMWTINRGDQTWVSALKHWFNNEQKKYLEMALSVGPSRNFF